MNSVLITGGSGFFGRGFVKTVLERNLFQRVCIFSRGEFNQAMMREEFNDDPRLRFFIGDLRDKSRLCWAMNGIDLVVHAAALKRIEVGRYNPSEMVLTNVIGTMNVIEAAQRAPRHDGESQAGWEPRRVIFLSSDKAFEPVSAYGQSKALAESLILAANETSGAYGPKFSVTRYGNVMGSTGSVVPRWRRLLEQGDEVVPVTALDCTRFAMTRQQAVDLVLTTASTMQGGEVVIPDLPAFSLGVLAAAMNAGTIVTGLPDWEKRHESMGPGHSSDKAPQLSPHELRELLEQTA